MTGTVKVLVPGGKASPDPPLGPEFGLTPVDVQDVANDISNQAATFDGMEVPVAVEYDGNDSFSIEVGIPPTAVLIKDEAGFDTSSDEPQENFVADVSIEQPKKIIEQRSSNLFLYDLKNASREVAGTCASLGAAIEGENTHTFKQRIGGGDFDDYFDDE